MLQQLVLKPSAAISATDTGVGQDMTGFTGNGYILMNASATGGAGQTSDVKLQDSADNSTGWADTGIVFSTVTNSGASAQKLFVNLDGFRKYVRVVNTLGGTSPTVTYGVEILGTALQK